MNKKIPNIELPSFEEMMEMANKIDRIYHVDNVTFCSDKSKYPGRPEYANLWFNHLPFNGEVYVTKSGVMVANMNHRPDISGKEGFDHQFALFNKYLGAKKLGSCDRSMQGEYSVSLEKKMGEFRTYGHDNGNNRLTFVFDQLNPQTGELSLYKIHTRKLKYVTRKEGDYTCSKFEPDPISPLEIIK